MTDIEQFERINSLLLSYGEILSSSQKEVLSAYYSYNLSISEIAEERNVSRAAVEDALKFANACGAICTTATGAGTALKSREQVLLLMKNEE